MHSVLILFVWYASFVYYIEANVQAQIMVLLVLLAGCAYTEKGRLELRAGKFYWMLIPLVVTCSVLLKNPVTGYLGISIVFIMTFLLIGFLDPVFRDVPVIQIIEKNIALVIAGSILLEAFVPPLFGNTIVPLFEHIYGDSSVVPASFASGRYFGLGKEAGEVCGWLIMGFFAIVSRWESYNRYQKLKYLIYCVMILAAVNIAGKRSHLLFGLLTVAWVSICDMQITRKKFFCFLSGVAAIVLLMAGISTKVWSGTSALSRMVSLLQNASADQSMLERMDLWKAASGYFLEHPLIGVGYGNFHTLEGSLNYDVHNVYLQVLTEMGLSGFVCIFSVVAWNYVRLLRKKRRVAADKDRKEYRMSVGFCLQVITFNLLYYLTENALYTPGYYMLFFLLLSVRDGENRHYEYRKQAEKVFLQHSG